MREECECGGKTIYVDHERVCEQCYLVKERQRNSTNAIEAFFDNRDRYSSGRVICQGGFWSKDDITP